MFDLTHAFLTGTGGCTYTQSNLPETMYAVAGLLSQVRVLLTYFISNMKNFPCDNTEMGFRRLVWSFFFLKPETHLLPLLQTVLLTFMHSECRSYVYIMM